MLISLSKAGQVITSEMYRQARGIKGSGTIIMRPEDFLLLTTQNAEERKQIFKDAQQLEVYNQYAKDRKNIHLPWLDVSLDGRLNKKRFNIGRILGQEGRHRAAALINAGISNMVVLLIARVEGYPEYKKASTPDGGRDTFLEVSDFPETVYGQFNNKPVKLNLSTFKSVQN